MDMKISSTMSNFFSILKKKDVLSSDSFITLLESIEDSLYNYILKSINFSEDADDVYQDTVLRALKYLHTFKSEYSFKTWIFTIATNQVRYYFKRNKPNSSLYEDSIFTDDDWDRQEKTRISEVFRIAEQLKPRQRQVFFLFYQNGFSIKEISEITGLKSGNIRFILNQSRESIKAYLGVNNEYK